MRRSLASFVLAACCIVALPRLGSAQARATARHGNDDRPTVRVSRYELRIVFPRDTARRWGWSAAPPAPPHAPRYSWRMEIDAIEGPRDLRFDVRSDIPFPSVFRSLRDLVDTGHGFICSYGMATTCGETRTTGTAEHGRFVLTLRDSTLITSLSALRPTAVRLTHDRPETSFVWDSVRVEYAAPGVQPLDPAAHAAALRARRRESLERFSVERMIVGGRGLADHKWLIVGDSLPLWLVESERHFDVRTPGQRNLTDSGWVVLDPRIAQLFRTPPGTQPFAEMLSEGPPHRYIKALRPGTTKIRVQGVHGLSDAALESEIAPGILESDLVVTRPPRRLEITPRPDTLRVGQYLWARVRVYDAVGESTDRVPVELACIGDCVSYFYDGAQPSHFWSNTPGRMTVVARLAGLTDTLSMVVVDTTRR